ncbi:MAG: ABC transporter substrate-binding protein [Oscillospiraceae bacterium]|nr:ABC transporter substrate-binding protein [Oscillospiraceae bacterium]
MKKLIALLLALTLLAGLAACGAKTEPATPEETTPAEETVQPEQAEDPEQPDETPEPEAAEPETPEEPAAPETVTFTDDCGRTVELPASITRIVPTGGLAQIALFANAPEMFVGLATDWSDAAKEYIPAEYQDLPVLGALYGSADLNLEELAVADPQVIIDLGEAKKSIVEDMDDMQTQTSIPSIHIEATLATMPDAYRRLGALLGKEERAEQIAAFCERIYARTVSIMEQVGENKVTALYVVGDKGLNVIANGSFHAEVFDLLTENVAVVENPAGKGSGNEVTMEQIALWDPEFVVFGPDSIYDTVTETDTWKDMTAITNGNYVEVPYGPDNWMGMPPSVQRYLSMIWLTAVLYPDYCDYDVKAEVKECYELLYSAELTDEQYTALTESAFLPTE